MQVLEVFANSWQLTVLSIALMGGCILIYLIRWRKKSDEEDKAYRASQAVTVRQRENH